MKRVLFYIALLLQIGIVVFLVIQSNLIDEYGKDIKLLTVEQEYYYQYDAHMNEQIYTDYDINNIPQQSWEIDDSLNYNEKVYVLLEQGEDGFHKVVRAGLHSFATKPNQIVIVGKYQYKDDQLGRYIVHYGIEELNRREIGNAFRPDQLAVVTVKIAPWGQKKVTNVVPKEES